MTKKKLTTATEVSAVQPEETGFSEWTEKKLTDVEKLELGSRLGRLQADLVQKGEEKKNIVSQFVADMKRIALEIYEVSNKLNSGVEMIQRKGYRFMEHATGTVFSCVKLTEAEAEGVDGIYRRDPDGTVWKIIRQRRMNPDEKQRPIDEGIAAAEVHRHGLSSLPRR